MTQSERMKLLIVEPNPEARQAILGSLSGAEGPEYDAQWAPNVEDAIRESQEGSFTAVLLSFVSVDAFSDALQRFNPASAGIPILALCHDESEGMEAIRAGAAEFIALEELRPPLLRCILRGISRHKRSQDALREQTSRLQLLKQLHEAFHGALDLRTVLERVYGLFPKYLDVDRASLFLYDEKLNALISDHLIGIERTGEQMVSAPQPVGYSISGACFAEGRPIVVNDCSKTTLIPEQYVKSLSLKSTVAVPILAKEKVIGVLRIDDTEHTDRFTPGDTEFLSMVAQQLGIVIENARFYTERKKAEDALREGDNLLRALVEGASDAIYAKSADGRYIMVNPACARNFRRSVADLLGKHDIEIYPPDVAQALREHDLRTMETEETQVYEICLPTQAGNRTFLMTTNVYRNSESEAAGVIAVSHDITERKRADRVRDTFATLGRNLSTAATSKEVAHVILEAANELFGWDAAYLHSYVEEERRIVPLITADTVDGKRVEVPWTYEEHQIGAMTRKTLEQGPQLVPDEQPAADFGAPLVFGDMGRKSASRMYVPIRRGQRNVGVLSIQSYTANAYNARDLELLQGLAEYCSGALERTRARIALHESEQRLNGILGSLDDAVWSVSFEDSRILYLSPAAEKVYGRPVGDFTEHTSLWQEVIHPDERAAVLQRRRSLPDTKSVDMEYRILEPGGGSRWVRERSRFVGGESGTPARVDGMVSDITARKEVERDLRQISSVLMHTVEGIAHVSPQGQLTSVNRAFAATMRYDSGEMAGMGWVDLVFPEDLAVALHAWRCMQAEGKAEIASRGIRKDGSIFYFEMTMIRGRDEYGKPADNFLFMKDVTQRKQFEREQEAIATIASALRTSKKSTEMAPIILSHVLELLNAEGAAYCARDRVTGDTVIELGLGKLSQATGLRLPAGKGIAGRVIGASREFVSNDIQCDTAFDHPDLIGGTHAVACVPLISQEQTIGALWAGRKFDITPEEVRLLTSIADIAANALHRAALHEETQRRLEHIAALRTIDLAITSSLDLRVTLNILLEQATSHLSVDAASVLMFDPHNHQLIFAAGRGFRSREIERSRLRMGEGHAGRAASERRIIALPNLAQEPQTFLRAAVIEEDGFSAYYAIPLVAKGDVKGVLELFHREALAADREWLDFLEALAGQAAIAIDDASLFLNLQKSNAELGLAYDETIEGWSRALDLRDRETEGHTRRVTEMTIRLARALDVAEDDLIHIRRGALLHDIGKMGIPDSILLKPGKLTEDEWEVMRKHPVYAYELLSPIEYLRPCLEIPYCHHEKWDGTGYPRGLREKMIPISARIFAAVDIWDALRSDRPYRTAWPDDAVREHLQTLSGTHLEARIVEQFLRII